MASSSSCKEKITVRIQYTATPPQVFVSNTNKHFRESKPTNFDIQVMWEMVMATGEEQSLDHGHDHQSNFPRGYRESQHVPVLRGANYCLHCLCSPCIITMPPDFLRGSCSPHPANCEKRYQLYRRFWRLLNDLRLWEDEEYLIRKEQRTRREDRRDIMPQCVIDEVCRRYPSHDGNYRDYLSTFDASIL